MRWVWRVATALIVLLSVLPVIVGEWFVLPEKVITELSIYTPQVIADDKFFFRLKGHLLNTYVSKFCSF